MLLSPWILEGSTNLVVTVQNKMVKRLYQLKDLDRYILGIQSYFFM